jgi:chromate transporter
MTTPALPADQTPLESRSPRSVRPYALRDLLAYMLRLGVGGFGGPVALVGYMHRDLVERRRWIAEGDYKLGLTLSQLAPGPLAAQLAMYLGFVDHGVAGATASGLAFVLPSFLMVLVLGWCYQHFQGLPWMQAAFYGVGACVIGIMANSTYKLTRRTIGPPHKDWLRWALYLTSAAVTAITESEIVWLFIAGGVLVWLVRAPQAWLRTGRFTRSTLFDPITLAALGATSQLQSWPVLVQLALFFGKAGTFVFGSGLAIVPFLYAGVVKDRAWLDDRQFLDAVAVAMITPGPVVITAAFIGFLVAGIPGACVATLATFLPCYLFTIIGAPLLRKHGKRPGIAAFVDGVTAAAIGAICGAVIVLGRRSIIDWPTAAITATTLLVLLRFKKVPEPLVVAAAAVVGLAIFPLLHSHSAR